MIAIPTTAGRSNQVPPRDQWPRLKQSPADRPACACGHILRPVSTQGPVTYYGPATCPGCGNVRPLTKRERRVDVAALRAAYVGFDDADDLARLAIKQ
jgi:hypothetical protein